MAVSPQPEFYKRSPSQRAGAVKELNPNDNACAAIQSQPLFVKACEMASVKPTRRQASRWKNESGSAFAVREQAKAAMKGA